MGKKESTINCKYYDQYAYKCTRKSRRTMFEGLAVILFPRCCENDSLKYRKVCLIRVPLMKLPPPPAPPRLKLEEKWI